MIRCERCHDKGTVRVGEFRYACPECVGYRANGEEAYCTNATCPNALGHAVPWTRAVLWGDYPQPSEPAYESCPECGDDLEWEAERLPKLHPLYGDGTLFERYLRRYGRAA